MIGYHTRCSSNAPWQRSGVIVVFLVHSADLLELGIVLIAKGRTQPDPHTCVNKASKPVYFLTDPSWQGRRTPTIPAHPAGSPVRQLSVLHREADRGPHRTAPWKAHSGDQQAGGEF